MFLRLGPRLLLSFGPGPLPGKPFVCGPEPGSRGLPDNMPILWADPNPDEDGEVGGPGAPSLAAGRGFERHASLWLSSP